MTRNMTGSDVNLRDDDKCDKAEEVAFFFLTEQEKMSFL